MVPAHSLLEVPLLTTLGSLVSPRCMGFSRILLVGMIAASSCTRATAQQQTSDRMKEIIENVRANEGLYKNLDVSFSTSYRLQDAKDPIVKGNATISRKQSYKWVLQDSFMYYKSLESGGTVSQGDFEDSEEIAYDGEYTRLVKNKTLVNKIRGRPNNQMTFRPHTWLLDRGTTAPLSVFLTGGKTLQAHPQAGRYKDDDVRTTFLGEDDVNGLPCLKLRCEGRAGGGELYWMRDIWLAPTRNYLPVRKLGFSLPYSKDLPLEDATVETFREITPGVWFPLNETVTVYNERVIKEENKLKVSNVMDVVVDKVSLDPHYDIVFFRDVKFPDGAVVYEIDGGKQVDAYIQGGVQPPVTSTNKWWMWVIASTVLALVVASGYLLTRRMRLHRSGNP
jgi:hypothetical protein